MNLVTTVATVTTTLTMSSREIAEMTGKQHNNVKRDIRNLFNSLSLDAISFEHTYQDIQNRQQTEYCLPKDETLCLVTGYDPVMRMAIIKRWRELESANPPQTYIGALKALIVAEEAKEAALLIAKHAIATKAEIGHRREATAMNTASQAVKRLNKLEEEMDLSSRYATIKRMQMIHHGIKFDWRKLKSACQDLDLSPIEVFDQNYGSVKGYPEEAWIEAYALTIPT